MANTFIARLNNDKEFNRAEKTINWKVNKNDRGYKQIEEKLKKDDNILLLGSKNTKLEGKLLIGKVTKVDYVKEGANYVFSEINEYNCTNEDLLKTGAFFPEYASQIKANTPPFIHKREINIENVIKEITNQTYINFYIFKGEVKYEALKKDLKNYDRVVIVNTEDRLEIVKLFIDDQLKDFPEKTNYNAKGLTLEELEEAHKISKNGEEGNNINAIRRIKEGLVQVGFYKFDKFDKYYDVLFNQTSFNKKEVKEYVKSLREKRENNNSKTTKNNNPNKIMNLNQILYGPPGTGKTYNTINKALEIIGEKIDYNDRKLVKERFNAKVKEGQIVFATFHQSMSYEDFIEGIKPIPQDEKSQYLNYEVIPGIFKTICEKAKTPNLKSFEEAYEKLKSKLADGEMLELTTPRGKKYYVSLNRNDNLSLHTGEGKSIQGSLTKDNIQRQINGEDKFKGWEGYFKGVINYLIKEFGYIDEQPKEKPNYVLIIDEINRGNVSQIFGELITLIEEDKRLGKTEELEITLPYSKDKFGVPSNLYIIGTMNTADRSVEALDTALRRRFSFIEMPPEYELSELEKEIKGHKLKDILITINNRIEVLLDKDHRIGHSYFMFKDEDNIVSKTREAFNKNIIPLLQEYFYGDYGKIGLALGEGFVEKIKVNNDNFSKFAKFDYDDKDIISDLENRIIYKTKYPETEEDFIKAIEDLMTN